MTKAIPKKDSNLRKGVELVIDIEVDGIIRKLVIPCPNCKENNWFLDEGRVYAYCGKCHQHIGYIDSDFADMKGVTWKI